MTRGEQAIENFKAGCNCSQAVLMSFSAELGLPREVMMKISAPFGGGLGRQRLVCGAVSGMCMAAGLFLSKLPEEDPDWKAELYEKIQDISARAVKANGSLICAELLAGTGATTGGRPEERTPEFYKKRPCPEIIAECADILDGYLREKGVL